MSVQGALSKLKVIELNAIGPVPFAGMVLADMGAEITRIDRIPFSVETSTEDIDVVHRGRRSIAIDLKTVEGLEVALRLIDQADVLIEGFRPGVMEKLGLGPDVCLARNPRLIYGRMTGWGQEGPLAKFAGHDINYIALTGALHAIGSAKLPPSPPLNLVGDYGGGAMLLLIGVLAALHARENDGKGQVVDAAMVDGAAMLMAPIYSMLSQGLWDDKRANNFIDGGAHFYSTYQCSDGKYIAIGAIEPDFYKLLLSKCDINVSEYEGAADREAWSNLKRKFADIFQKKTRAEWCALLEESDACFAPVLSLTEAPNHFHLRARSTFMEIDGSMHPAPAPRLSRTKSAASTTIPQVGQHTEALLTNAAYAAEDVARLISNGVVYATHSGASEGI